MSWRIEPHTVNGSRVPANVIQTPGEGVPSERTFNKALTSDVVVESAPRCK